MYLHIGGDAALPASGVVGFFDLDGCSRGRATQDFLKRCETDGILDQTHGDAIPRSFIVTGGGRVFLSSVTTATLDKRLSGTETQEWIK
jgi:regulator of extracellular matrix RemA (YlzA/DUF370 family)